MHAELKEKDSHSVLFISYLIFTAMLCGAAVMVVEILGSRVIGPFFGVSLFVWTALITVALISLAIGYAAGGLISDRKGTPDYLYGIILLAGLLIILIPVFKGAVLKAFLPLGLRTGALLSCAVLFGPSFFALGCVSPYIVKIAAKEMKNIGRTVGIFYAISTAGSVLGTVFTGFFLIAYFSVNKVFWFVGIALICLSLTYLLIFRRRLYFMILLIIIPFFLYQEDGPVSRTMPGGTQATRLLSRDSFYGNIKVIDYLYGPVHTRELAIDGLVQGGIDVANKMPIYNYFYFLEFIPYILNPAGKDCLVIGLGAGIIPMWYENLGIRTDIVDIDPNVIEIARDYFGFRSDRGVIISDAKRYLINSGKKYDYIILDVFNGDTTPGYLLSIEAFRLIKERLTEKGILAINLIGSLREESFMTASVVKTLGEAFETVEIYPAFSVKYSEGSGNLAIVAYNSRPIPLNPEIVKDFPVHPFVSISVGQLLGTRFSFPSNTDAIILSDDYNPIDFYDRWLKEKLRKDILETTDADILM